MDKYKAPIGGIPATVLKLLLNIAGAFTKRITHIPSRQIVDGFLQGFVGLVTSLSDADPSDDDQIKAVVNQMLTEGDFYEGTKESIRANIVKVKNKNAKDALNIVLNEVYLIADILTDEVNDDGEQLERLMKDFISSEGGVSFLTSTLKIALDDDTANLIALIIVEALRGVITDDKKEAFETLRAKLQSNIAA